MERRVLVHAPTAGDSAAICDLLSAEDLRCLSLESVKALSEEVAQGAGAVILSEEGFYDSSISLLSDALNNQPSWSALPLIILTHGWSGSEGLYLHLQDFYKAGKATLLERPVSPRILRSVVDTALADRDRQYQLRDQITEIKRQQQERLQIQKQVLETQRLESLGVMAGGLAHDFNNLLVGVLANSDLILGERDEEQVKESVLEIQKAARQAAKLCQQLLAYSGKKQGMAEHVDITAQIDNLKNLLEASIPKRSKITYIHSSERPIVLGDSAQISQVILNLVTNAGEAVEQGEGEVRIETGVEHYSCEYLLSTYLNEQRPSGKYVYIRVSDNGVGMDEATLKKIFDPFYSTRFTGRGLGLSATLGVVRGHKGAIEIESTPGKGTTFTLLFPAAETRTAALTSSSEIELENGGAGKETILFVDDSTTVRLVARKILLDAGYHVHMAENGKEGLEAFVKYQDKIDLTILDLAMPVMDGEETLRAIRKVAPGACILLTSGYDKPGVLNRFTEEDNVSGFIPKPFNKAVLLSKLRDAIENRCRSSSDGEPAVSP